MSIFSRTLAPVGLVLAIVFVAGCSYSQDQDVFASRPLRPTTLTLIDTVTKKPVWSMDIPVGEELAIDYNGHHLSEMFVQPAMPGKKATWELYRIGEGPGDLGSEPVKKGTIQLSGDPIRARVSYRKPEPLSQAAAPSQGESTAPSSTQPKKSSK